MEDLTRRAALTRGFGGIALVCSFRFDKPARPNGKRTSAIVRSAANMPFEPFQRCALTSRPVAGRVESTEFTRQRCYQQVGFRREIAVKRADGDADSLGNGPHLDRLVTTRRSHGQSCIQNRFPALCGGARARRGSGPLLSSDRVRF